MSAKKTSTELIQSIVQQTMVLIAQLATNDGSRAPLSQLANQVFLDLVNELEREGVGRRVVADMFGLGLRTFQRKLRRLTESSTDSGRSLWEAILDCLRQRGTMTRAEILQRFSGDDENQVCGVLYDLCDSSLVVQSGKGTHAVYRVTSDEELGALRQARAGEGLDELIWVIIYREGPLTREALSSSAHLIGSELEGILDRLLLSGRIGCTGEGSAATYQAGTFCIPFQSPVGWEAAIFDHFHAMVKTIVCRMQIGRIAPNQSDKIGGSTYTLDVWPGHPMEQEAVTTLSRMRSELGALRQRVEAYNAEHALPDDYTQVVFYAGQCLVPQEARVDDDAH